MSKHFYISADYDPDNGDRNVVEELEKWSNYNNRKLTFTDMAKVVSGSVSVNNPNCRPCELKEEFNKQINASSTVIFVVGDKTAKRTSGSVCSRASGYRYGQCTPYKQNTNGLKYCNNYSYYDGEDVSPVNNYSYLRHEFEEAKKRGKKIVIVYNSTQFQSNWLPTYMRGYESIAFPFWKYDSNWNKVGDYIRLKKELGYE